MSKDRVAHPRVYTATILERAECKHVPFHALRHTFATQALRYGMDVKTLASTIGHESVETTLNVYSHTTDEGMRTAANRIDRAMGAISGVTGENDGTQGAVEQTPETRPQKPPREKFEPRRGKYRRQGTGSIHQVSKNPTQDRKSHHARNLSLVEASTDDKEQARSIK